MADKVALRKLVKNILNTYATDPYSSTDTRPANQLHFYDESDGINLSRGNTFPKGYIKISESPNTEKDNLGVQGFVKKYGSITIFYYTKEKQSYISNSITYKNEDLVNFMLNNIHDVILNNRISDYHLFPTSIIINNDIRQLKTGNFKVYEGLLTVTYYWYEKYGI